MPIVLAISFSMLLGFGLVYPLLPYLALELGLQAGVVPMLLMVDTVATLVIAPIWGSLSDRFGRSRVLGVALLIGPISFLMFALADGVAMLFAARILSGASYAALPVIQALLADTTKSDRRLVAMASINTTFAIAFVVGPLIVTILYGIGGGIGQVICLAVAVSTLAPFLVFFGLRHQHNAVTSKSEGWDRKPRIYADTIRLQSTVIVAIFLVGFAYAAQDTTIGVWAADAFGWGPEEYAWVFVAGGVSAAISQIFLITRVSQVLGEMTAATLGVLGLLVGLALLSITESQFLTYVACMFIGGGTTTALSCLQAFVSQRASPEQQGRALGCAQSGLSMAFILGPIWGGFAFSVVGPKMPFLSGCLVLIVSLALLWRLGHSNSVQTIPRAPQEN